MVESLLVDRGPLAGFRVVDLSENMAGPFATMILGDQGADVVKVESLRGDQIRRTGSGSGGMAAYFANLNRSKRSIALDLLRPKVNVFCNGSSMTPMSSSTPIDHKPRSSSASTTCRCAPPR